MTRWATMLLLLPMAVTLLVAHQSESSEIKRLLTRQSSESQQEATTAAGSQTATAVTQQPARLYPDLPRQQPNVAFLPPFNARPFPPGNGPAPFVPFGFQMPMTGRLNEFPSQQPPPMRPMSAAERMQSQTFVNGLGRRLLSMIGIDMQKNATDDAANAPESGSQMAPLNGDELMRALRNSSVLQQLNSGVHSVYGSLSKMYNSTIQQQLDLLQDRLKRESENSTNPWQQRMAEQVPQFFANMVMKVRDAQQNLNRIWHQVTQANNGSMPSAQQNSSIATRSFSSNPMDQFMGPNPAFDGQGGGFFNQLGRQFGMNGGRDPSMMDPGVRQDLGGQLMDFWHNQVQPQIGMVRGQVARIWRDLTSSGALMPETINRSRNTGNMAVKPSDDIVDSVLKEVEASGPEYMLIQPSGSDNQAASESTASTSPSPNNGRSNQMNPQIQNRLIAMQRELNQLWNGLSNSLQNALTNVRNSMHPRDMNRFDPLDARGSDANRQAQDPAENEISDKIQDLNKIQRDADNVYSTVQRQQTQMQRTSLTDRFMNFFGNMDMDQFQDRIGNTVNRFGNMVGNFWNQIPERWDNFMMQNRRQQETMNGLQSARVTATSTTHKPTSPATNQS